MRLLVKNIGTIVGIETAGRLRLCGGEMDRLETFDDAWLLADDGRIAAFGSMDSLGEMAADEVVDAGGGMLFPSFCDSHTHLVYAGSREQEFLDKINGLTYEQIARRGGGILNSADLLHRTSEEELYRQAMGRIREIAAMGRCGGDQERLRADYGRRVEDAARHPAYPRDGAAGRARHVPRGACRAARLRRTAGGVCRPGLLRNAACGGGRRTGRFRRRVLRRRVRPRGADGTHHEGRAQAGHARQDPRQRTRRLGRRAGGRGDVALSVDHLERMGGPEIGALHGTETSPTMLPGAAFFLGMSYPPAREMINAGLGVALASDYNPGSSPSGNMRMVVSLACIRMRMTPAEAINAATLNGAYAMGLSRDYGSVTVGKVANFFLTVPMPSVAFMSYAYTTPLISRIFLRGEEVVA
ncbi:MAG: amidohydrolase family protein [Alistipes onderdonkii]